MVNIFLHKNTTSTIDLKLNIISHFSFLWHERSNLVKVCQGQRSNHHHRLKTNSSTGLLHRAKLIHAFAAENVFVRRAWRRRRELVQEECAVAGCEILSRLVDGLYNGLHHIHLKSPFLRCFRVTNSSTYMVIIYSHRLTPNTPSQQMM